MKDIFQIKKDRKGFLLNAKKNILSLFLFTLVSCIPEAKPKVNKVPTDLIPKDTFELLLKDLYSLEGVYFQNTVKPYVVEEAHQQYALVFNKYACSLDRFKTSLDYYQQLPDSMIKIYDHVMEKISIEESTNQHKEVKKP